MAKSREDMQNIALYHMDKLNRRTQGERDNRPPTLEEQLKEEARRKNLTPEQRRAEKPWGEWCIAFRDHLESRETRLKWTTFSQKFIGWVMVKHKAELEEYHRKGTAFSEFMPWLIDKQMVHMNL